MKEICALNLINGFGFNVHIEQIAIWRIWVKRFDYGKSPSEKIKLIQCTGGWWIKLKCSANSFSGPSMVMTMHLRYDFYAIQTKGVIELKLTTKHSHTQHPCGCGICAALCLFIVPFSFNVLCMCFFRCLLDSRIASSLSHFTVWHTLDFDRDSPIFTIFFCVASHTCTHEQTHKPLVLLGQNSICNIIYHSAMNFRSSSSFGRVEFFSIYLFFFFFFFFDFFLSHYSLYRYFSVYLYWRITLKPYSDQKKEERRKERQLRTKIERKPVF